MTENIQKIRPGTPEMEALLMAGYPDLTVEKCRRIIAERAKDPRTWPYEQLQRAEAFLAAWESTPIAVSTKIPKNLVDHSEGAPDNWRPPSRSPNR